MVEDEFMLPVTTFSVSMRTSLPNQIRYIKRVEQFENIDLWRENLNEKIEKRCQFSLRGTDFVSIVDDIMMRLEIKDEGFCIEISRLTITNSTTSQKITMGGFNYLFQAGSVKDCTLMRDSSLVSYSEFQNRRRNKATVEYGIVCVVTDNNQ